LNIEVLSLKQFIRNLGVIFASAKLLNTHCAWFASAPDAPRPFADMSSTWWAQTLGPLHQIHVQ
jgi:hypothetical protein